MASNPTSAPSRGPTSHNPRWDGDDINGIPQGYRIGSTRGCTVTSKILVNVRLVESRTKKVQAIGRATWLFTGHIAIPPMIESPAGLSQPFTSTNMVQIS